MCGGVECHVPVSSTTKTIHTLPLSSTVLYCTLYEYECTATSKRPLYCTNVRIYKCIIGLMYRHTHNKISYNIVCSFLTLRSATKRRRRYPQMGFFASVSFGIFLALHRQHRTGSPTVHLVTARRQATVVQCTMLPRVDKTEIIIHK